MRIAVAMLFAFTILVTGTGCFKEKSVDTIVGGNGGGGNNQFEVKIDGKLTVFNVIQATLLRSTQDDMKRMDLVGISSDGNKRLIITLGDRPAAGNAVTVKEYIIDLFNEDDPNTPEDESAGNDDGYLTWSEKTGNSWLTDVYAETGKMTVTSCNPNTKKVTGTFSMRDSSYSTGQIRNFTEGKFNDISYIVVN